MHIYLLISKNKKEMSERPVLVVDNGAGFVKIGIATQEEPFVYSNCIARSKKERGVLLVGDAIQTAMKTHDLTYYRPFDRGCAANWDVESAIWKRFLSPPKVPSPGAFPLAVPTKKRAKASSVDEADLYALRGGLSELESFAGSGVVYTEPPFCPEPYRRSALQALFEELEFASACPSLAGALALRYHFVQHPELLTSMGGRGRRAAVVVDSGFSFTHVVPFAVECPAGSQRPLIRAIEKGVRRVDVGGKTLTNVLKEAISFRQWNMMDEVALVNDIKEKAGFVSLDIEGDLARPPAVDYVLPDYVTASVGQIVDKADVPALKKEGRQLLPLGVERFAVPEALFNPSDVGIEQCGVVDAAVEAIKASGGEGDPGLYDHLCSCVLLRGGSTLFKNFAARFERDLNPFLTSGTPLAVFASSDPVSDAWKGGIDVVTSGDYEKMAITKSEYEECDVDYLLKKHRP